MYSRIAICVASLSFVAYLFLELTGIALAELTYLMMGVYVIASVLFAIVHLLIIDKIAKLGMFGTLVIGTLSAMSISGVLAACSILLIEVYCMPYSTIGAISFIYDCARVGWIQDSLSAAIPANIAGFVAIMTIIMRENMDTIQAPKQMNLETGE